MHRHFVHISRHLLRAVALVLLGLVLLYFALTRTQVGRDQLRNQIEQQFASSFAGELTIGRLTGNLAQDLFGSDVRLYDTHGRLVLEVDSLVARPSWRSLFSRRLSVRSLSLIRPTLHLVYQSDSTWNLSDVFSRSSGPREGTRSGWSFDSADLILVDGTVTTDREAQAPPLVEQGWTVDFSRFRVRDLQMHATVEWTPSVKLFDLLQCTATLPDVDTSVDVLQGQLLVETDRLLVNELTLKAGETEIALNGSVNRLAALRYDAYEEVGLDVTLGPSRLDLSALRRLIPRLPLGSRATVEAHVSGTVPDLTVERAAIQHGTTRLELNGALQGWPDSLHFRLATHRTRLATQELQALLPDIAIPDLDPVGTVALGLTAEGTTYDWRSPLQDFHLSSSLDLRGEPGHVAGRLILRTDSSGVLTYDADVQADTLDLAPVLRNDRWGSALNGRLRLEGRHLDRDSLAARLTADLHRSALAGRQADSLHLDASFAERRFDATLTARRNDGRLFAHAVVNLTPPRTSYRLGLISRRVDLGPLMAADSLETSLNTQWTLAGSGTSWDVLSLDLTMAMDSSRIAWGGSDRLIPPHVTRISVSPNQAGAPRLHVAGDVLSLTLAGTTPAGPLQALGRLWHASAGDALYRHLDKPYRPLHRQPMPSIQSRTAVPSEIDDLREEARLAMHIAGLDSLTIDGTLSVRRSDILSALLPVLPWMETDVSTRFRLVTDPDHLRLSGHLEGDSLRVPGLAVDAFRAGWSLTAVPDAAPPEAFNARLDLSADSLRMAGQSIPAPELTLDIRDREGLIRLATDRRGRTGPGRLTASLELLPDRNRVTLLDVYLSLGDYIWTNATPAEIDLFADATVIPGLQLQSTLSDGSPTQRIRVRGTRSQAASDTLYVEAEAIGLRQLSDFLSLRHTLGGQLDGRIALTGRDRAEITGALTVADLLLDERLLGHLEASSRYLPGQPDIALDVRLRPSDVEALPAGVTVTENRLHLDGTFRLPRWSSDGAVADPGALDLTLDAGRADAFFFEYLFDFVDQVEGAVVGGGTIQGNVLSPRFDAAFEVRDGRFDVPRFNLRYTLDGPVRVDEEGFKLRDVALRDPTGGTASVSGDILFNDYRFFSFDLTGALDDLQIIDVPTFTRDLPFYGQIWASGNVTLTGPLSHATLESTDAVTHARSEIYIPVTEEETVVDPGFIVFADSTGEVPDVRLITQRRNILASRPVGERAFLDGLEMDLNIFAPQGSTVHLVIDPLLGDVINAVGSGRIQLLRQEGDFSTFGTLSVDSGDYLFTAGEVFVRRFLINDGTLTWDGDPLNARLDINAAYRTRAASTGLPDEIRGSLQALIPLIVKLHITDRVFSPVVDLSLAVDRSTQEAISDVPHLETYLNQPDRAAEHATSVLLTNTFLLSSEGNTQGNIAGSAAFNSVSQLVSSQLNRYLSQVLPNADFQFGLQGAETTQDLDVTAGLALRLLNERLVIRGQGVYRGLREDVEDTAAQGLQGEFVVEVRLSASVSIEVFFRRESDVFSESLLTSTTGAGLSYRTQFPTWQALWRRLFGTEPDTPTDTTLVPVVNVQTDS